MLKRCKEENMLTLATFNLCNLGVDVPPERLQRLGVAITGALQGPDILVVQEIMAVADGQAQVPADETYRRLIAIILSAGGPAYEFREVPPLANQDGGQADANIRIGLLFNPKRIEFVDRGRATAEDATGIRIVNGHPALTLSPGRITPTDLAFVGDPERHWAPSRKSLAGELRCNGETLFCIICHLKSMRSVTRREENHTKQQRHAQATLIHRFVANLLACDPGAHVVILGDMNDVPGSKTLKILKGSLLSNLLEAYPRELRYTRRHGNCPQALDHILVSQSLRQGALLRIPHINSDSPPAERASDHDPVLAMINL
jgi:predicted extracellular nuclease